MDISFWIVMALAIIFIPPVLLMRPLIIAIANRINGKNVNTQELKLLKEKVQALEDQVMEMRGRMLSMEDSHDFSRKMLEDVTKRTSEIERKN